MMMWFFLVSDALSFSGLIIAYGYIRHTYDVWPVGEKVFNAMPFLGNGYPLLYVALMTFILIVSSVTMVLAVEAGHRLDKKGVIKWLALTVVGILGARTRDLFVGDSLLFFFVYLSVGKILRNLVYWIVADATVRGPFMDSVVVQGGLASVYMALVGVLLVTILGGGKAIR